MHNKQEFMKLASDFKDCRAVLVALGDENRLHILYQMMITVKPMGMRVGDIVKMSSLSRPAVSHHMKILKDAGFYSPTKNAADFEEDGFSTEKVTKDVYVQVLKLKKV